MHSTKFLIIIPNSEYFLVSNVQFDKPHSLGVFGRHPDIDSSRTRNISLLVAVSLCFIVKDRERRYHMAYIFCYHSNGFRRRSKNSWPQKKLETDSCSRTFQSLGNTFFLLLFHFSKSYQCLFNLSYYFNSKQICFFHNTIMILNCFIMKFSVVIFAAFQ